MRIIAGSAKGRKLITPKNYDVRPTLDRVKESLFSMIQNYIADSVVVDLFAGTGNLGIEALSRGAKTAYFVDNNRKSIDMIEQNLIKTKLKENAVILKADIIIGIEKLRFKNIKADLIFADPPYVNENILLLLHKISDLVILSVDGLLILEHDKKYSIPTVVGNLVQWKKNEYGNTSITIFRLKEED
ncbi:MAG: 16S rRNA (guanine(966)-N(2))-methyltransferase RsmD [Alkaliphilus sp.]|nr:MAG: 16S rRNA (guanine(966)-N(2))-methyltransferase RsmD [Alkaliphilus sp.]